MTLVIVLILAALAVVLAAPLVRVLDRAAGYPLALILFSGAAVLGRAVPDVLRGEVLEWHITWAKDLLAPGVDASLSFRGDALSVFFALLALGIGGIVFVYSAAYLPRREGNTSFYLLMTAFTLAVLVLVLANDAVMLFIGWELVSMASFLLIARSGGYGGEAGSQRTLVLTFIGGLTLLAALCVAAVSTHTLNLAEMLRSPVWAERPGLTALVAVLVAASAFTKSAQLPFHLWLPEAMAAATPVSAFLHAAAVVKAGIYLLLRFSTVFHDVAVWNWILVVVGILTAVMSALFAVQKTDLKKLTAYSTVSHLGWIVATIGIGTPVALAAAVVHTLAHALFKSSLFMLIGVVDHEAGSRDIHRLGANWKKMPWTFGSALIGALSMAAVPPMFGFISKEGMLTAFQDSPVGGRVGVVLLLIAAGIGALLTFTYSAKFIFGAFLDGPADPHRKPGDVHEAPVALWLPAALPGVLSLPLGLAAGLVDGPADAVVEAIGLETHSHLALWHGLTVPLGISAAVIVLGCAGLTVRKPLWAALERRQLWFATGNRQLELLQKGCSKLGRALGTMASTLDPSRHLVWPVLCVIALTAATFLGPGVDGAPLAPRAEGLDNWLDLAPFLIVVISVVALVLTRHRISAVVFIGAVGVGITLQMLILGAPDVALTQFLVEALVVVIMLLVVRHQPTHFARVKRHRTVRSAILAVLMGVAAFSGVYFLMGRRDRSELAMWYVDNAPDISGGKNIVATIIVEFRALDTLGELSVLGMAAVVIAAVVSSVPRAGFAKGTRPRPFSQSQLNSLPLKKAVKLVFPVMVVMSAIVFWRGHQDPGGGFVAALIAGTTIMLAYLSRGRDTIVMRPSTPFWLTGIGVIVALTPGFIGMTKGSFLYPIHGHVLGQHLTTSLVFDAGIYLAVLGMLTAAVNYLGGYLRPGMDSLEELNFRRSGGPLEDTPEAPPGKDDDPPTPQALEPAEVRAFRLRAAAGAATDAPASGSSTPPAPSAQHRPTSEEGDRS